MQKKIIDILIFAPLMISLKIGESSPDKLLMEARFGSESQIDCRRFMLHHDH